MSFPPSILDLNSPHMRVMVQYTREALRDYPELNRLTAGHDHSDRHIMWAVLDTLSDWASTPPFIGQGLEMIITSNWISLFCKGVVCALLKSLSMLHTRNYLAYSDGGVNVQTENPQLLQAWIQLFQNEYEEKKQRVLIAKNIEGMMSSGDGVHSEYLAISALFGGM